MAVAKLDCIALEADEEVEIIEILGELTVFEVDYSNYRKLSRIVLDGYELCSRLERRGRDVREFKKELDYILLEVEKFARLKHIELSTSLILHKEKYKSGEHRLAENIIMDNSVG